MGKTGALAALGTLLEKVDSFVWGPWMLALMLGTGIFLMFRMRFLPLRRLAFAIRCACCAYNVDGESSSKEKSDGITPFSSLMTELAATIGTGNIVGVASAMVLGGPGALFWMVVSSFIGMSTKFAESMLAVKYRVRNEAGEYCGGPMYTMVNGLKWRRLGKCLGYLYAFLAFFAALGMGNMTQTNSVAAALKESFRIPVSVTGLLTGTLILFAVAGGIRKIAKITQILVPVMSIAYLSGALMVILLHPQNLLSSLAQILCLAWTPKAAAGGVLGQLVGNSALRYGISRGVFSNEAGLGAAGISAAATDTADPVRQGYISMTGVFFDTVVICSITGIAIASSGMLGVRNGTGELLTGAELTIAAFSTVFGELGGAVVSVGITMFALATAIAWAYQGEKAFEFLTRGRIPNYWYRCLYGLAAFLGAVCSLEEVWNLAELINGLMAVPNLLCVLLLSGEATQGILEFETERRGG